MVLDTFKRESLVIHVDKLIKAEQVCKELRKIKAVRGLIQRIKVDRGSEFISRAFCAWSYFDKVKPDCSRPGTSTDNPHFESFNRCFRDECLNTNRFISLEDVRDKFSAGDGTTSNSVRTALFLLRFIKKTQ